MRTASVGSAHGRFQPFHLGHLEYVLAAAAKCDFLWIGITQPEIAQLRADTLQRSHRYQPEDNPLSYWERLTVIQATVADALKSDRFAVVPFPIERPTALPDYVPLSARAYTTVYDDWNRQKVELLTEVGYTVEILWTRDRKQYVGSEVRRLLRTGDPEWRTLVPSVTARVLDELGVVTRLQDSVLG